MKRTFIAVAMAAVVLCTGCSGTGEPSSSALFPLESSSSTSSSASVSSGSSASHSSGVPSSGSNTSSSAASKSSSSAPQGKEPWNDEILNEYWPRTNEDVIAYYETHPEFMEYYLKYIIPYEFMNGSIWQDGSDIPVNALLIWALRWIPMQERKKWEEKYRDTPRLPVEEIDAIIKGHFDIDTTQIRRGDNYLPDENCYYITMEGTGMGPAEVAIITQAQQEGDELSLTVRHLVEHNYPVPDPNFAMCEEVVFQLRIRLLEDGTFRYLSSQRVN